MPTDAQEFTFAFEYNGGLYCQECAQEGSEYLRRPEFGGGFIPICDLVDGFESNLYYQTKEQTCAGCATALPTLFTAWGMVEAVESGTLDEATGFVTRLRTVHQYRYANEALQYHILEERNRTVPLQYIASRLADREELERDYQIAAAIRAFLNGRVFVSGSYNGEPVITEIMDGEHRMPSYDELTAHGWAAYES